MMKHIWFFALLLGACLNIYAQGGNSVTPEGQKESGVNINDGKVFRIRNTANIEGKQPLIVIDGVEKENDYELRAVKHDEIVSMTVLKDSVATEKYGDKGKNGVIVITTKKGSTSDITVKGTVISENHPLFVIDGKEMPSSFTQDNVDREWVHGVSVLKNESATALYGEKGKNGVVLITTKTGAKKEELPASVAYVGKSTNVGAGVPVIGYSTLNSTLNSSVRMPRNFSQNTMPCPVSFDAAENPHFRWSVVQTLEEDKDVNKELFFEIPSTLSNSASVSITSTLSQGAMTLEIVKPDGKPLISKTTLSKGTAFNITRTLETKEGDISGKYKVKLKSNSAVGSVVIHAIGD